MIKLFLLFSHDLTDEQHQEIKNRFKVDEIIKLPQGIQEGWSNIPPKGEINTEYFNNIMEFLKQNAGEKNYAVVQGEFGAIYIMVNWCFENGFVPIYSTTKRVYEKEILDDGTILNKHFFKHVNFRHYVK